MLVRFPSSPLPPSPRSPSPHPTHQSIVRWLGLGPFPTGNTDYQYDHDPVEALGDALHLYHAAYKQNGNSVRRVAAAAARRTGMIFDFSPAFLLAADVVEAGVRCGLPRRHVQH